MSGGCVQGCFEVGNDKAAGNRGSSLLDKLVCLECGYVRSSRYSSDSRRPSRTREGGSVAQEAIDALIGLVHRNGNAGGTAFEGTDVRERSDVAALIASCDPANVQLWTIVRYRIARFAVVARGNAELITFLLQFLSQRLQCSTGV